MDKKMITDELSKLMEIRADFLEYLDENIPKKNNNIEFDFEGEPMLDAKKIHEHFFKLDYQSRKLRAFWVNEFGVEAE